MVQLEAMLYKRPVVATKLTSGASTVVKNGETGFLVTPESSKELSEAMTKLLDDPAKNSQLGENGYSRLQENYTFSNFIAKHMSLYRSLIENS